MTDGLTNGAEGVIENIDFRVSFPHLEISRKQHREYAHLYNTHIYKNGPSVLELTKKFRINKKVKYKFFGVNFHFDLLLPKVFIVVKVKH